LTVFIYQGKKLLIKVFGKNKIKQRQQSLSQQIGFHFTNFCLRLGSWDHGIMGSML
jgi:hypothetical protein